MVTGGGSSTALSYEGLVTGSKPAAMVIGNSLEDDDVLDTSDAESFAYRLGVAGSGKDSIDFAFPEGASVCVEATAPDGQLLVGPNRVPLTSPIDLDTLGACKPEVCGTPTYSTREHGTFLWQDCATGTWRMRFTRGDGVQGYTGSVVSDQPLALAQRIACEGNDIVDLSLPGELAYRMVASASEWDGIDFQLASGASACVDATEAIAVGPDRALIAPPFDLLTLGPCAPEAQCGALTFDKASEHGTFVWQDCDTGQWHLRVTGGGAATTSFTGTIDSNEAIASIAGYSFEADDVLDTGTATEARYTLNVGGTGQDGLDFVLAADATTCLDAGGPVVFGPDRTLVASPFDLTTLKACTITAPPPPPPPKPTFPYLEDADTNDSTSHHGTSDLGDRPFPRITTGPVKSTGTAEQFSKYGVVAVKAFQFDWLDSIQAINPDTKGFRIHCPQEYQGWAEKQACRFGNGMPFDTTGPATANCQIYAGHWVYAPGTTLKTAITASFTTLQVADATRFNAGRYVVIYDGGAGAFQNAEHAQVTAVNTSTNTLTLAGRGYKSTARGHAVGAIVAEHTIGNGDQQEPENWVYNLSTVSPRDANGRQVNEIMADWLAQHYAQDHTGAPSPARIDGILFDSDFHFIMDGGHGRKPDIDNDLVQDDGLSPRGENLWGEGLDAFYRMVRERLPNLVLVGGVIESRGYTSLNGTQLEGWPQRNLGTSATPDYREINGRMSVHSVQMHHGAEGPRYSEGINKMPTKLYPSTADPNPPSNSGFRFGFGLMLLDDGHYGQQNWHVTDPWWDEYAVDVVPGSPTYGQAMASNPNDERQIRQHLGWMGMPLGPRVRVFDPVQFAAERNLLTEGTFDGALGSWRGNNLAVDIATATANRLEGTGALHASMHQSYAKSETGAAAIGPSVTLKAGVQYTLAFAVKAAETRTIQVAVGDQTEQLSVPDQWTRQVLTFTAPSNGTYQVKLNLGRENTEVWIDAMYLFEGNADVFRRDFDNAVVLVNATPSPRTVSLGGTFRRIRGTGQDPINDGATVTQVTIPAYDSAVLIRPY